MWKRWARLVVPGAVRRRLQRWRLDQAVGGYPRRVVRHRYDEWELSVELSDPLAAGWYDRDWPPLVEVGLLRAGQLRPGATVFDLGAHQGVVALMLARVVGQTGRVVAVEALPHNAAAARRNCELNVAPWVEVVEAGVAAADGTLRMSRALNAQTAAASDYGGTFEVPTVSVDTLAGRYGRPAVLFIDVEGMEVEVLRGAARTLAAGPDVFVEVHVGCGLENTGGSVEQVLGFLPADRYQLTVHTEAAPTPVPLVAVPPAVLCDRFFLTAVARRP